MFWKKERAKLSPKSQDAPLEYTKLQNRVLLLEKQLNSIERSCSGNFTILKDQLQACYNQVDKTFGVRADAEKCLTRTLARVAQVESSHAETRAKLNEYERIFRAFGVEIEARANGAGSVAPAGPKQRHERRRKAQG